MKGTRLKIKNVRKCVANYILEELFFQILKQHQKTRVIRRLLFTRANKNVICNLVPLIHDPFSQKLWGRD